MISVRPFLPALLTLPLAAQAWDVRLETPFAKGQDLPRAVMRDTGQAVSGTLDSGKGLIFTLSHRIVRVGPVLKLEWNGEYSHLQADGQIQQGAAGNSSRLRQDGIGVGVNAQFWVPFTGLAGELGLTERFHAYRFEGAGAAEDKNIARPWLRLGTRWNLPFPGIGPYVAVSYQLPLTKDSPVADGAAANLASYLGAQGSGQEFKGLWTLGAGISF